MLRFDYDGESPFVDYFIMRGDIAGVCPVCFELVFDGPAQRCGACRVYVHTLCSDGRTVQEGSWRCWNCLETD